MALLNDGRVAPAGSERERPPSPWTPLRHRVFLALWIAQIVSNVGTFMQNVGAAWLMGDLGGSATLVALVQSATALPVFLLGIPAGALADIFDRRRVLILTQGLMLVAALGLAALSFTGHVTPASLLALTFLLGMGSAMSLPAYQAVQPELVPRAEFPQAVALGSLTFNVGRAVGPAFGGLVVALAGPGWVFLLNAVSFVGVMAVLGFWRRPRNTSTLPPETLAGAMRAGLRYAAHSPALRQVLLRSAALILPASVLLALLPVVARGPLDLGAGGYGVLLGCFGLGAALAAVARPRLAAVMSPDRLMAASTLVMAFSTVINALVEVSVIVGAGMFVAGAAWTTATVTTSIAAQASLPSWVRARGMGLYTLVTSGSIAIGSALWGGLASWNLDATQLIAAAALVASIALKPAHRVSTAMRLDLTTVAGEDPEVTLIPRATDGPVLITIAYRVPAEGQAAFTETMRRVERARRRTGAYQWNLFRDLADPDRFLETYLVESWAEHLRQHRRSTEADMVHRRAITQYMEGEQSVTHYVSTFALEAPVTPVV